MLGPGGRVRRGFFPQVPPLFLDLPFLIFHIRACAPRGAPRCAGPAWPCHRKKERQFMQNECLRNVAIIAHADHGKTTPQG